MDLGEGGRERRRGDGHRPAQAAGPADVGGLGRAAEAELGPVLGPARVAERPAQPDAERAREGGLAPAGVRARMPPAVVKRDPPGGGRAAADDGGAGRRQQRGDAGGGPVDDVVEAGRGPAELLVARASGARPWRRGCWRPGSRPGPAARPALPTAAGRRSRRRCSPPPIPPPPGRSRPRPARPGPGRRGSAAAGARPAGRRLQARVWIRLASAVSDLAPMTAQVTVPAPASRATRAAPGDPRGRQRRADRQRLAAGGEDHAPRLGVRVQARARCSVAARPNSATG